jgi:hypothetical protein
LRNFTDFEGHEGVNILIDIRKIHEDSSMAESYHSAISIFSELRFTNRP